MGCASLKAVRRLPGRTGAGAGQESGPGLSPSSPRALTPRPQHMGKFSWAFCRAGGALAESLSFCPGADFPSAYKDHIPFRCSSSAPFPLPHQKFSLFLLPELLELKGKPWEETAMFLDTEEKTKDLERKVQKRDVPFYFLTALFRVRQRLKTKESTWLLGGENL